MIIVFYDDLCGLCSKEISHYKSIAPESFLWVPISTGHDRLKEFGITISDALKLLHLVDDDGITHKGVDSFLVIWRELNGWKYLARVVSLPIVRHLICGVYFLFAEWRFRRLSHCKIMSTE